MHWKELYKIDKQRNPAGGYPLRYICLMRISQSSRGPVQWICRWLIRRMRLRYGLELPWNLKLGKGLYLGHAFNITVNPDTIIGDWCNLHKGVTIGQENRGRRKGSPTLGNRVYVGINATIVGKVTIGDDVLIASGAYVNCDVPSHSVVIGNPCQIYHKENATEGYVIVPES